jgi:hypothetical protein
MYRNVKEFEVFLIESKGKIYFLCIIKFYQMQDNNYSCRQESPPCLLAIDHYLPETSLLQGFYEDDDIFLTIFYP